MSEHFSQAILFMNIMQVAESIERVKAVRKSQFLKQPDPTDRLDHVPQVLRRAYTRLFEAKSDEVGASAAAAGGKNGIPFDGKEFLLCFDPCIGLEEMWVDAALFYLLNGLRSDMARR